MAAHDSHISARNLPASPVVLLLMGSYEDVVLATAILPPGRRHEKVFS
jgi:hypothetical protein